MVRNAAEYREQAAVYVREAASALGGRRVRLLEMAQSCLRSADEAEQTKASVMQGRTAPPKYTAP
jgi:hypothetical protein